MNDDPIVAEVREARAKLMKECGFDLNRFLARIQEMERQHPDRMISKKELEVRGGGKRSQKTEN